MITHQHQSTAQPVKWFPMQNFPWGSIQMNEFAIIWILSGNYIGEPPLSLYVIRCLKNRDGISHPQVQTRTINLAVRGIIFEPGGARPWTLEDNSFWAGSLHWHARGSGSTKKNATGFRNVTCSLVLPPRVIHGAILIVILPIGWPTFLGFKYDGFLCLFLFKSILYPNPMK